jgi:hypothetical protein
MSHLLILKDHNPFGFRSPQFNFNLFLVFPQLAEEATAALSNLSESPELQVSIVSANGIHTAIKTLMHYEEALVEGRERSPEIHTYTADFLVNLLSNSK